LSARFVLRGIDRPPAPELGVYPGADDIAHHPDTYLNDQVSVTGQVVSTDPLIIRTDYETDAGLDSIRITLTDVDVDVERGDTLQVIGVLTTLVPARSPTPTPKARWRRSTTRCARE
jgi:hypothetical protein